MNSKKRKLAIFTAISASLLGSLYVFFAPAVFPLYNSMLFMPWKYPEGHYDIDKIGQYKREDVYFAGPAKTRLNGWYFSNPESNKTVIFSHGQGANITAYCSWAKQFLDSGASVLIYDYEGYGRSEGSPSVKGLEEDGQAAYDYVLNVRHVAPSDIVVCGFSLGSGVASAVAATNKTGGLILIAPYVTLKRAALDTLPLLNFYPPPFWPESKLGSWDYLGGEHVPLLILHGVRDQTIPVRASDELFKHATEPKSYLRLENFGHGGLYKADIHGALTHFLSSLK